MAFTSSDVDRLTGAAVRGSGDEKIGSIGQVYVDPDGAPTWATVRTGLFGTSESFVPLDGADFDGRDVTVPFSKDVVKHAPRVESDGELDEQETDELYDYYSGRGAGARSDDAAGRDAAGRETDSGAGTSEHVESAQVVSGGDAPEPSGAGAAGSAAAGSPAGADDGAMTRSEERLRVGTERVESGRARLRKHIVTEQQTVTVPVTHEEARIVREPISDADLGDTTAGAELSEEEHEVALHGERVVTSKETVPVERVRLGTERITEQREVSEDVRSERIDVIAPDGTTAD